MFKLKRTHCEQPASGIPLAIATCFSCTHNSQLIAGRMWPSQERERRDCRRTTSHFGCFPINILASFCILFLTYSNQPTTWVLAWKMFLLTSWLLPRSWWPAKLKPFCGMPWYCLQKRVLQRDILTKQRYYAVPSWMCFGASTWTDISWNIIALLPWYSLVLVCLHYQCWPMTEGEDYITAMNNQWPVSFWGQATNEY